MKLVEPLSAAADRRRPLPPSPVARFDAACAAVDALRDVQRRSERLGLELPQARAHEQLRYWRFVRALCAIAVGEAA